MKRKLNRPDIVKRKPHRGSFFLLFLFWIVCAVCVFRCPQRHDYNDDYTSPSFMLIEPINILLYLVYYPAYMFDPCKHTDDFHPWVLSSLLLLFTSFFLPPCV